MMTPKKKPDEIPRVWVVNKERYEANRYSKTLQEFSPVVVCLEPSVVALERKAA